jgi:UDP-N-acetyl-D-glucosamine dehydrogenase
MREHASLHGRRGVSWHEALTGGYDAALIATDHDGVDYAALVDAVPLVLDTRNVCHRAGLQRPHIVKA